MPEARPVPLAVTGIGAVSALGWGVPALEAGLLEGRCGIGRLTRFDSRGHRTHLAGEVPSPPEELARDRSLCRLSLADRFAVAAAREAVAMAGLAPAHVRRMGVACASSAAGLIEGERHFDLTRGGARGDLRLLISHHLGSPGSSVARALGAGGPLSSVSSACASGGLAIENGCLALREGEADVFLAGGSDSISEVVHAGFNSLRAVDHERCRPFRAGRAGLTLGEGAGFLVLETLAHARERGVKPLALLRGTGSSCDAHHMTAPHAEGRGAAFALRAALADAGLAAADVGHVNCHGTGTGLNDPAEWAALRDALGERAGEIPVSATKALVGHLLGAAGALEAVATVLCLRRGFAHPIPLQGEIDPRCPVDLVMGGPRALRRGASALSLSLGFGGANAALVFAPPADAA